MASEADANHLTRASAIDKKTLSSQAVGSRVAFTTPRDSSNVLSLEKLDDDEGGTDGGEAAEQGDQATKSA